MEDMARTQGEDHLSTDANTKLSGALDLFTVLQDAPTVDLSARIYSAEEVASQEQVAAAISNPANWDSNVQNGLLKISQGRPTELNDQVVSLNYVPPITDASGFSSTESRIVADELRTVSRETAAQAQSANAANAGAASPANAATYVQDRPASPNNSTTPSDPGTPSDPTTPSDP
ncbi:MAG: hypothetical protein QM647_05880, partial [Asticcacaulis sp.]|uniref:hypothetical protein n=1 Tax=Asticcacaulis sp. TaxID=1872648 RepID=UPI0039E26196